MSDEKKFVDGLFVKEKELKYGPITELSFKVEDFKQFLDENKNAKGYVNVSIMKSRDGKPYAKLNDWKPDNKPEQKPEENFSEEPDLPF